MEVQETASRLKEVAARRLSFVATNLVVFKDAVGGTTDAADATTTEAAAPLGANRRRVRLRGERACEPSDYIWEHLAMPPWRRALACRCGWLCVLCVPLLALMLDVALVGALLPPPLRVPGAFTHRDGKCTDLHYLRQTPGAAWLEGCVHGPLL